MIGLSTPLKNPVNCAEIKKFKVSYLLVKFTYPFVPIYVGDAATKSDFFALRDLESDFNSVQRMSNECRYDACSYASHSLTRHPRKTKCPSGL